VDRISRGLEGSSGLKINDYRSFYLLHGRYAFSAIAISFLFPWIERRIIWKRETEMFNYAWQG